MSVRTVAILYGPNPMLAIQGGNGDGQGLTLEAYDPSNQLQQWYPVFQANTNNNAGVAFVNVATGLSVGGTGSAAPLTMQGYTFHSANGDAWTILSNQGSTGVSRILWPNWQADPTTVFSWNDWGGKGEIGDQIYLYNDTNPDSTWLIVTLT